MPESRRPRVDPGAMRIQKGTPTAEPTMPGVFLVLLAALQSGDRHLAAPAATVDHDFSRISGIRELADGRLLVSDWIEETVSLADAERGVIRVIGRRGTGPAEYRLPGALLPLLGDSTLLIDEGNERLAVIGPDLRIVRSFSSHRPGMTHGITPRGVDRRGRFYFEIPAWADPAGATDSVSVALWDPVTDRVERLVRVRGITYREGRVEGIPYIIFAPRDIWQVDPAGRVALVRSAPYHVEWRETNGALTRGTALTRPRVPVTTRERFDYVARFMATAVIAGRGEQGMTPMPASQKTPEAIARLVAKQEFREVLPPFSDRAPLIGSDGTLWVERSVGAGKPPAWDRFDSRGTYLGAIVLPVGRRLLAIGRRGLYAAAADSDGLERVERYAIPTR